MMHVLLHPTYATRHRHVKSCRTHNHVFMLHNHVCQVYHNTDITVKQHNFGEKRTRRATLIACDPLETRLLDVKFLNDSSNQTCKCVSRLNVMFEQHSNTQPRSSLGFERERTSCITESDKFNLAITCSITKLVQLQAAGRGTHHTQTHTYIHIHIHKKKIYIYIYIYLYYYYIYIILLGNTAYPHQTLSAYVSYPLFETIMS